MTSNYIVRIKFILVTLLETLLQNVFFNSNLPRLPISNGKTTYSKYTSIDKELLSVYFTGRYVRYKPGLFSPSFLVAAYLFLGMPSALVIESIWRFALETFTDFQLKAVVTFAIHEIFYWGTYIPFLIADAIPYCRQWKVQPEKQNTSPIQYNCMLRVLINHFLLVLPIIIATHPIFDLLGMKTSMESLPTASYMALQVFIFFLVEDFVFYWGHRALHLPYLYKHVHSIHHHHAAPFGIAAEYAHPVEVIFLGTATLMGPMIFPPHLLTLYVYLALRCMQTVECHSGYDFPWSLNRWFPLYGGAYFHDHHHRIHSGNYASTFIWVDALFGTDSAFQLWKRKRIVFSKLKQ